MRLNRIRLWAWLTAGVIALVLGAGCSSSGDGQLIAGPGELGHIHDLVVDDDGNLLVASHTGIWRIDGLDRAVLIGSERHDLMAMAGLENGDLIVSGHPDLRLDEYHVEDHPPLLGLTRSGDGGRTWEVVDLLGDADFHALVPVGDQIFVVETTGRIWRLDSDGTWEQLGAVEARDLAVNPADPSRQLAPDHDGNVWFSSDGAATWSQLDAPPVVEIEWPTADQILFAGEDGTIWGTTSPDAEWTEVGSGPGDVETFHIDSRGRWWLTVHGGAIARSDDDGGTWVDVYLPPARP